MPRAIPLLCAPIALIACTAEPTDRGDRDSADDLGDVPLSDDFLCEGKEFATARGMAEASDGTLYAVGDCDGLWIVRRRAGDGAWVTVDSFLHEGRVSAAALAVAVDVDDNVVVTGFAADGPNLTGIVRVSEDGGTSWQTVETTPHSPAPSSYPESLQLDGAGRVLLGGNLRSDDGELRWVVARFAPEDGSPEPVLSFSDPDFEGRGFHAADDRIYLYGVRAGPPRDSWVLQVSEDEGATWEQLAPLSDPGRIPTLTDVVTDPDGKLRALGATRDPAMEFRTDLVLRTSEDGGLTWRTELHHDAGETHADAAFLAVGPDGALFVGGDTFDLDAGVQTRRWLVRRSDDDGKTWTTVQNVGGGPGAFTQIRGVFTVGDQVHAAGTVQVRDRMRWIVTTVPSR
jgi:hypothetical protein